MLSDPAIPGDGQKAASSIDRASRAGMLAVDCFAATMPQSRSRAQTRSALVELANQ